MSRPAVIAKLPARTRRAIEREIVRHGFAGYENLARKFAQRYGVSLHPTTISRYGWKMRFSPEGIVLKRISSQLEEILNLLQQRGEPRAGC